MADFDKDPLEGFQITDYDSESEVVTVQIDRRVLRANNSLVALQKKCADIIEFGPNVKALRIEERDN